MGRLDAVLVWTDIHAESDGWKRSAWYGWFNPAGVETGWVYHLFHQWVWLQGPAEDDMWTWDQDLGWLWTARAVHPYFYHLDGREWLYYQSSTRDPRWYYNTVLRRWAAAGSGLAAPAATTPESVSGVASQSLPVTVGLSDGTYVEMPPLNQAAGITLGRETGTHAFAGSGLVASGAVRTLALDVAAGLDPDLVTPLIAIPLAEAGNLDPDTLNIVRLETVANGDGSTREQQTFLPVTIRDGRIVARDYLMPETIVAARAQAQQAAAAHAPRVPEDGRDSAAARPVIRYQACSFAGSLNYRRMGQLVRMIPDREAVNWRVPYDRASAEQRRIDDTKLAHNIVVLVHGHNEEEKGGIYQASAEWPWLFAYKRDVWTQYFRYLYTDYFTFSTSPDAYLSPEYTTRFYEFVYPSYRGAFNDLDEQLAARLEQELGPQLRAGIPFNMVLIAHSMGGLVARAAIQQFSPDLDDRFKELITWGTPHLGSPLVTLRYVLAADLAYDFNTQSDDMLAALTSISGTSGWGALAAPVLKSVIRRLITHVQMDAPGTRDLRYVRRPMQEPAYRLGLERLFQLSAAQQTPLNEQKYNLQSGSAIYNFNLQLLNQNDRHAGSDRYFPIIGRTDHRVEIVQKDTFPWFELTNMDRETAQGATIMPLLVADPDEEVQPPTRTAPVGTAGESDGAVNIPSMAAIGISNYVGTAYGWDHEDYYGAPDAAGVLRSPTLARNMATFTIARSKGGSTSIQHDRLGLMPTPQLGYRIGHASNLTTDTGMVTDIGYADTFTIVTNLRFNALDELREDPYRIFDRYDLRVEPAAAGGEAVLLPITDVDIAPATLPFVNRTGGTFVSTAEYAPANPRIMTGKVAFGVNDGNARNLNFLFTAADGTRFQMVPALRVQRHSPAGVWKLDLLIQNNEWGNGSILRQYSNRDLVLDAAGHAVVDIESSEFSGGLNEEGLGEQSVTTWHLQGTASLINNRFVLDVTLTREYDYTFRRLAWNPYAEAYVDRQTTTTTSSATAVVHFAADVYGWTNPANFRFVDDSVHTTSSYELTWHSQTDTEGVMDENVTEQYAGADFTVSVGLRQP